MKTNTIWFNKSFADVANVAQGIRDADTAQCLRIIVTHPVKPLGMALPWCEFHKEPNVSGEAYLQWALEFCRAQSVDVFVCGKQASFFASHKLDFAAVGTKLLVATSSENFSVLDDKDRTYQALVFANEQDMVPPYEVAATSDEFETALSKLQEHEPLCFKPTISIYGIGFRILTNEVGKTALSRLLSGDTIHISKAELQTMMNESPSFPPLMVMPYLAGSERSIDCLAYNGELVACVIRRKMSQGQVLEHNPELVAQVRRLVKVFGLDNFFNAQFREKNGQYYLLEINPRMSGGTHYTFHSQLNLPFLGAMLNLGLMSPADVPAGVTGVRVYPVEGSVASVEAAAAITEEA